MRSTFAGRMIMSGCATMMMRVSSRHHAVGASFVFRRRTAPPHQLSNCLRRQSKSTTAWLSPVEVRPLSTPAVSNSFLTRRYLSSSSSNSETTTTSVLPNKTGDRNGLIRHEITADDGHPLRLYSRSPSSSVDNTNLLTNVTNTNNEEQKQHHHRSILLLHGRTWSSQPVFDLRTSDNDDKQQSTLQSLADLGFNAYALDFRGFGETPRDYDKDGNGYATPRRCVADVKCAIDWITKKHGDDEGKGESADGSDATTTSSNQNGFLYGMGDPTFISKRPALLGWSQGALVAQMYAQQHGPSTLSDLILFGSIFDPRVIYPRKPLYDPSALYDPSDPNPLKLDPKENKPQTPLFDQSGRLQNVKPPAPEVANTDIAALEDFTLPGSICDEAAMAFLNLALAVDPIKGAWDELHEFVSITLILLIILLWIEAQLSHSLIEINRTFAIRRWCVCPR